VTPLTSRANPWLNIAAQGERNIAFFDPRRDIALNYGGVGAAFSNRRMILKSGSVSNTG